VLDGCHLPEIWGPLTATPPHMMAVLHADLLGSAGLEVSAPAPAEADDTGTEAARFTDLPGRTGMTRTGTWSAATAPFTSTMRGTS
jgi:hypothetical protein